MADEQNTEQLVDGFINRFDTEINDHTLSARSSIREEADRCKYAILQCFDKDLPIFESLTLGFSRKIELELVNFNETARALRNCMKHQLVQKLHEYYDDAVEDFIERATAIIYDESETLRENLRSQFLEVTAEKGKQATQKLSEFQEIVKANDFKQRCRPTAMMMRNETYYDDTDKKDVVHEIGRRKEDFDTLLKMISDDFTEQLSMKTRIAKKLIDHFINTGMSVFGNVLMSLNDDMYRFYNNNERIVNATLQQALEQLYPLGDKASFEIVALALQEKANQLFEKFKRQIPAETEQLEKFRVDERRELICRNNALSDPAESIVYAIETHGDVLYDGRIRQRNGAPPELDLDGVELQTDDNGRVTCELRKTVVLKCISIDSDAVECFAVQKYAHTNLLRCLGTATYNRDVRYLVFDYRLDILASALREKPDGLSQDDFIHFATGLQQALQYLHEINLYHGDLQPENVYFDWQEDEDYSKVKLAHLSTRAARAVVGQETAERNAFSAPEAGPESTLLLLQKSDVWSFGTIIWFALTGLTPCEEKITELPSVIPTNSSVKAIGEFLQGCWAEKPEDRPSVYEVGEHIRGIITDIAFAFDEDAQWTEECAKWKTAAEGIDKHNEE